MKKSLYLVLAIFYCVLTGFVLAAPKEVPPLFKKGESLYVYALHGLNMRKKAAIAAEKMLTIPYGAKVLVVASTETRFEVQNIQGYWIEVDYKGKKGFVFDGFLASLPAPLLKKPFNMFTYAATYLGKKSVSQKDTKGPLKKQYAHGVEVYEEQYEVASSSFMRIKNIRLSEGFLIARSLAISLDWWMTEKDIFPARSHTYKETYRSRDGQTYLLDVEVSVSLKGGSIVEVYIAKESDGYRRILSVKREKDGVLISFTTVD